jgi:hypothetical protein
MLNHLQDHPVQSFVTIKDRPSYVQHSFDYG